MFVFSEEMEQHKLCVYEIFTINVLEEFLVRRRQFFEIVDQFIFQVTYVIGLFTSQNMMNKIYIFVMF